MQKPDKPQSEFARFDSALRQVLSAPKQAKPVKAKKPKPKKQ